MSRLGERETGGPNRSPFIDLINARFGLRGTPWCGAFASWAYAEAGVDDSGLCHPSTALMCQRARDAGAVWGGHSPIPPGALWVNCGVHVAIVTRDLLDGTCLTVEGNHNDSVATGRRATADGIIIIPPAVAASLEPESHTEFWLEDTRAQPKLFGPWNKKVLREHALESIPRERRKRVRLIRAPRGGFAWLEGPRRLYGPWAAKDARDEARKRIEARLNRELRPFSRTR